VVHMLAAAFAELQANCIVGGAQILIFGIPK
jgi:hypothetical protein